MSTANLAYDNEIHTDESCEACTPQNISQREKVFSLAAGTVIGIAGFRRGGIFGLLATGVGAGLLYRGMTGHCHLYQYLGLNSAQHPEATVIPAQQGVHVKKSVTINRPAHELFEYWRSLEKLPKIMTHIKRVEKLDDKYSRWTSETVLGQKFQWDAEIFNELPDQMLAWRSLEGADIDSTGSLHFTPLPDGRGTVVTLTMKYNPPGGKIGDYLAGLLGKDLETEVDRDLRNFKQLMETGQLLTTEGQPRGPRF